MANVVHVGGVAWHWAGNLVCAGPDERLVVIPETDGDPARARKALAGADRMEWRDAGFRKWRVVSSSEGIAFSSHYARFGPVVVPGSTCLAGLSSERLEKALAAARTGAVELEGNPKRQ